MASKMMTMAIEGVFSAERQRMAKNAARINEAGDLHDEVLDCVMALEVETSPRHGMATRNRAVAALDALYQLAVKGGAK